MIAVAGPGGKSLTLEVSDSGLSTRVLPIFSGQAPEGQGRFFSEGTWMLSGGGGAGLLPFQFPFHLPPPLRVLDRASLSTVRRNADLTVRWDPRGYGAGDEISLSLGNASGAVNCRGFAWAGSLTVSREILGRLSATDTPSSLALTIAPLQISREKFMLARPVGQPVHGVVSYGFTDFIRTEIQ